MKKTEKIRYEIDPHNRLVYEKTENGQRQDVNKQSVRGFRTVLDGAFEIDENNRVTYHVKKSQGFATPHFDYAQRGSKGGEPVEPQQIKLKGKWALDNEHNLTLTLDKWGNQIAGNKLTVESELIDAKSNMLSFAVTSKDSENNTHIYIVKLGGRWQADEYNRLTFNVEKEIGAADRITLRGAWEIINNNHNEIIYTYEKSLLGKKEKVAKTITFKGYWDIAGKHRIIYVLNKEIKSEFEFKVSVGKPAERGLKYEIGVGARPGKKTITLFGGWKISKKSGLLFEMPYAEAKSRSIILGGWGKLDKNQRLELRLQNKIGEDLGIDVKLSGSILEGQGETFIRALKERKEVSIVAGAGFRW